MSKANLQNPIYKNDDKARLHLEALRWPDGPICPHCGSVDNAAKLEGKSTRPGVHKCRGCRKPFSVTVGTLFERSHIPLSKWLLAVHLMSASKKGMSALQLSRMLGLTYKSAWFMAMRIREAMRDGSDFGPVGGGGEYVEVDETYIGNKKGVKRTRGWRHKEAVMSLVERGGKVRSHHVPNVKADTLRPILMQQISKNAILMTDEASQYKKLGQEFKDHRVVQHSLYEYVRGNDYTNTIEGYFSIFKRGMKGVYQHCSSQHLKRYLSEFDFRYNEREALGVDDATRSDKALKGIEGKRLTYRRIGA